jgi:hypothetical protein
MTAALLAPNRIVAAWVRSPVSGAVYVGTWHGEATDRMHDAEPDLLEAGWEFADEDGFVDSSGALLDRAAAWDLARSIGQASAQSGWDGDTPLLLSCDVDGLHPFNF